MNDTHLMKFSLAGAALSVLALYVVSLGLGSVTIGAGDAGPSMAGQIVKVSGEVRDLQFHKNGHIFFSLRDGTGDVRVVLWESDVERLELAGVNASAIRNGMLAEVTGTIEMYRGEAEIVPVRADVKFGPPSS
jgi:aspartyl/asparaginyl-tRNA synthetase